MTTGVFASLVEYKQGWGYVVRLIEDNELGYPFENDVRNAQIEWVNENSQANRISYDTWKFKNKRDAEEFQMLFKLRWP